MLPLVDKPIIQYGVEEAVASGIDNIILVTGRGKNAIEDHFDVSVELETFLEARGKREQLEEVRKISNMINFAYVRQGEPLGLGHAVLVTRELVGDEPFAVILGDDVIDADPPAIKQMIDVFERVDGPVLAVERVPREDDLELRRHRRRADASTSARASIRSRIWSRSRRANEAPSDLAIIGRYILTPDIFPALAATKSDRTGEIQLTNGLRELLKSRPIYACEVKGVRHDTGNKLGFLKAVVYFALRRPDLADKFSAYLTSLNLPSSRVSAAPSVLGRRAARRRRRRGRRRAACSVLEAAAGVDGGGRRARLSTSRLCRRCRPSATRRPFRPPPSCRRPTSARCPCRFFGVVGDVPAAALELNRRRRHQLVHRPAALRAGRRPADRRTSGSSRSGGRRRRTRIRTEALSVLVLLEHVAASSPSIS